MDCVAIGDSIAVGIAAVSQCEDRARVGRSSAQVLATIERTKAGTVIISVGSNDPTNPELLRNLRRIRDKVKGSELVVWISPYNQYAASAVKQIAMMYGDGLIDLRDHRTKDGVHPSNYVKVASEALTSKPQR